MRLFRRGATWYVHAYDAAGVRRQVSTRCQDRRAAETAARAIERRLAGADRPEDAATVADLIRLLEADRKELARAGRRSAATEAFYRSKARHVARVLGPSRRLSSLTAGVVDELVSQRRAEGAAEATIAKELCVLRVALKLGRRRGLWTGDLSILPIAFAPEYRPRTRALADVAELERLLAQLVPDRAARVAFIVATSASWSESERARREDVGDGQVLVRGTKRATRHRVVPVIAGEQRSLLRYALEHAEGEGVVLFAAWPNVCRDLAAACSRAGIERVSPNDLRRTFARWWRAAGALPADVGAMMGHADARMVERVYGRLSTAELARAVTRATGAAPVHHDSQDRVDRPESSDGAPHGFACDLVPRDGVEPPTRGFSIQDRILVSPKKNNRMRGSRRRVAAPVQQRRRG